MSPRFENQVAVITGGAAGIGRHVALRLAGEGATVALWDVDQAALDAAQAEFTGKGFKVETAKVDVGDEQSVAGTMVAVATRNGRIDALVHCAGIVGPNARKITEVTVDEFDRVMRVNTRGSFLVTKHALLAMQPRGYGRILLFASIAGKEGNAGMCSYSTSKAAVIGLVKSVGKEFAESGITINAIAPGVIRTAMVDALEPRQVTYMTDKIPMKRTGTLDEVAALSCWAVSSEASFTTAFTFDLSGGRATY
ncbi:MAG: SDR family oxidoreductase [Planctomycetes bacterium]|nr:SDR family oxidoreductase [Planctomycetota bacterium]